MNKYANPHLSNQYEIYHLTHCVCGSVLTYNIKAKGKWFTCNFCQLQINTFTDQFGIDLSISKGNWTYWNLISNNEERNYIKIYSQKEIKIDIEECLDFSNLKEAISKIEVIIFYA